MKLRAEFTLQEHQEFGGYGLGMVGRKWADPFPGLTVAHDMLEHSLNDTGTTEEELMALGASLWVRDYGSYFNEKRRHNCDPAYQLSGEFRSLEDYRWQQDLGGLPITAPRVTRRGEDEEGEDIIQRVCAAAVKDARDIDEFPDGPPLWLTSAEIWKVRGWFRLGLRAAKRRFKSNTSGEMCQTFLSIEDAADAAIKACGEQVGTKVVIVADTDRCRATWAIEDEDY